MRYVPFRRNDPIYSSYVTFQYHFIKLSTKIYHIPYMYA